MRIARRARRHGTLHRFTWLNRLLLSMAFLPTGLVKVTGHRFTRISVEHPIGFFFEALYQSGPFWIFIGAAQVAAALLLLVPRTATLGAVLFLPVAISVFLITWGLGFGNTVFITGGMLLSVGWLLFWDIERIGNAANALLAAPDRVWTPGRVERAGWWVGGLAGMAVWMSTRGFVPSEWVPPLVLAGIVGAILVLAGWFHGRRTRAP